MKKRLLSLVLALVLCLGLTVPALAEEASLQEVIPCELWNVRPFSEGLARVQLGDEQFGFIDKTGTVVLPGPYKGAWDFSEGLATVSLDGKKYGYIDQTGKEVIPYNYDDAWEFSEGLAQVKKNGKWGYIDRTGEEVIPCQYQDSAAFSEGFAQVKKNGKWGFIDQTGKEIVPCKYTATRDFSDGFAMVEMDGKRGYIDNAGKEVIPCQYEGAGDFSDGLVPVRPSGGKWGFINPAGEEVISQQYQSVSTFFEGLALVMQNDKWGYIDQTGKEVIPCQYDDAWGFFEGFAPVMQNGKWGYINKAGELVVPLMYDEAGTISDGMALVAKSVPVSGGEGEEVLLYGYLAIIGGEDSSESDEPEEVPVTAAVSGWAKEQVDSAAASGLIADGLGDDYRVNITRAQFAGITVKLYEAMSGEAAPAAGDSPFTDSSDPAVIQAAALGFVGGMGDGKFDPDAPVTREQAALMLSRVYTKLGGEIPAVEATTFADDDSIVGYAKDAIAFMSENEIVGGAGDNKFDPKGNASIEQALVIALRMFEKLK